MAYWLFKTEPSTWSWDDQVKKGEAGEEWNGVRNHTAKNQMLAMKIGDLGFFYHSVDEKSVVGIVKVIAEAHPDSKDTSGTWSCVDVAAVCPVPQPVSLAAIKAEPRLAQMALVKFSRLSVQPVTDEEWAIVCGMGGLKKPPKPEALPAKKPAAAASKKPAAKKPAAKAGRKTS